VLVDPIDRFLETPLATRLNLGGVEVNLSTNDPAIIERLQNMFPWRTPSEQGCSTSSSWRIVVEDRGTSSVLCEPLSVHSASDNAMAFIAIGQSCFLAYDWETRRGVSFCSANLVRNEALFTHHFVSSLVAILEENREAAT
jgi:hypothetical protein